MRCLRHVYTQCREPSLPCMIEGYEYWLLSESFNCIAIFSRPAVKKDASNFISFHSKSSFKRLLPDIKLFAGMPTNFENQITLRQLWCRSIYQLLNQQGEITFGVIGVCPLLYL